MIFSDISSQIEQIGTDGYYDDYAELLESSLDLDDFLITGSGITFIYQIYSIAPYAAGEQRFTVPFEAFGNMLKPEIAALAN